MSAEALNCPSCGAGVASDHSFCDYCKVRLKTTGCPKCLGLMFEGSRFCGHCGAIAAPLTASLDEGVGDCPRCREQLERLDIGEVSIHGCKKCDGLWVAVDMFENVCASREQQAAVLGFLGTRTVRGRPLTKINYVPCPDCGQLMNRNNFARASGVIVDICKHHGVWFDADELPSILDFIQKGGMERARQREREELRDEREKLLDDQRRGAARDARLRAGNIWDYEQQSGIRGFVRSLFD